MAASLNKVMLIGNLGNDPELKYTQSGVAVASFSIATSSSFTDKNGARQEKTEWHRIVAWSQTAENCARYLKKGRQVYIEGSLQTRQWQDRDGQNRYTTEVVAQRVQFLGKQHDSGVQDQGMRHDGEAAGADTGDHHEPRSNDMKTGSFAASVSDMDDVPF